MSIMAIPDPGDTIEPLNLFRGEMRSLREETKCTFKQHDSELFYPFIPLSNKHLNPVYLQTITQLYTELIERVLTFFHYLEAISYIAYNEHN